MFGDSRVHVTFLDGQAGRDTLSLGRAPARRGQKTSLGIAPPPGGFAASRLFVVTAGPAVRRRRRSGTLRRTAALSRRCRTAAASFASERRGGGIAPRSTPWTGRRAPSRPRRSPSRGVVTGTRHLFNPEGKTTHGQGTAMLPTPALPCSSSASSPSSRGRRRWPRAERPSKAWTARRPQAEGTSVWSTGSPCSGGMVLRRRRRRSWALACMGLKRRGKSNPNFIIGSDADADAPVSPEVRAVAVSPARRGHGLPTICRERSRRV